MLKLRTPIQTVLKPDLLASQEAFSERITGNYMQIGNWVDEADLLHVVTEPPEIFLVNGGMTSLVQNASVENNQIRKVEIINNLINRIMVSADAGLSYQDNVYITNILHKLGIRDERKFMKEVYRLTRQTKEQNETVNLYWENLNEIREMVEDYTSESNLTLRDETEVLNQNVLHLHEEVNRRLNTAAIYRIMQNFYENVEAPRTVTNAEYKLSETTRISREILLNRLREAVRGEAQPLIYRHENVYEGDETDIENVTFQEVNERITSAVLLNLIDNIYESTYERLNHNISNWISAEDTFYGAAENTLYRIEQNTAYLQYLKNEYEKNEEQQNLYRNEIDLVTTLLDMRRNEDLRIQQSLGGNSYSTEVTENRFAGDTVTNVENREVSPADITYRVEEGDTEVTEVTEGNRSSLEERIYQTYQQNIARNERYMQSLKNITEQYRTETRTEKPEERTRQEAMLALEHPEQFLADFEARERDAIETERTILRESEKLLSPEQQVAHRLIREYIEAPQRFYNTEVISKDNMGLLLLDIQQAEREESGTGEEGGQKASGEGEGTGSGSTTVPGSPYLPRTGDTTVTNLYPTTNHIFRTDREFMTLEEREAILPGEKMVLRRESEIVNNVIDRVVFRWMERSTPLPMAKETYADEHISMVHRSKETTVDEEVIENLQNEIRRIEDTNRTVSQRVENITNETRTVVEQRYTTNVIEENKEEIRAIVNRSVKQQLDTITDRVYGKLEKQLRNEQRRRGL